jgi:exopolyphosphatase/guanosine-5'-triphosphate,3'-diphosphate pyrophosphatase
MTTLKIIHPQKDKIAALDLGSNSFHLLIGRHKKDRLKIIKKIREPVRLAAGISKPENNLSPQAMQRGWTCLEQFAEHLEEIPTSSVRAVGTSALRQAVNASEFCSKAKSILGLPVEIISGHEEARLIYTAVRRVSSDDRTQLIIDIGGGSTEIALGRGLEPDFIESLALGCVNFSEQYFPSGDVDSQRMQAAEQAAAKVLDTVVHEIHNSGWSVAMGCSGTIKAINKILNPLGGEESCITRQGLWSLREAIIAAGHVGGLEYSVLRPDHLPVLAGGLSILCALFESLKIETLGASEVALREGVLQGLGLGQGQC